MQNRLLRSEKKTVISLALRYADSGFLSNLRKNYKMKKVLIIEDNKKTADRIGDFLRGEGFEVDVQTETQGIYDACKAFAGDLILVDHDLGPGLNGEQFVKGEFGFSKEILISISGGSFDLSYAGHRWCEKPSVEGHYWYDEDLRNDALQSLLRVIKAALV